MAEASDEEKQQKIRATVEKLTKELTDRGLLIEAGWMAFRLFVIDTDEEKFTPREIDMFRCSFFAGSQHLWASIISLLEEGTEPTDADMKRMDLINTELTNFVNSLKSKGGEKK
jgi:hypothetical protein